MESRPIHMIDAQKEKAEKERDIALARVAELEEFILKASLEIPENIKIKDNL